MAAEDIGALSVTLSLNSDSFSKGMQSIERQMKANDAAFQASIAESGKLGTSLENLGNKQQFLTMKLENQKTALDQYGKRITELSQKYADLAAKQKDLPAQIDKAKQAWQASEQSLKAHEKAADLDADAMEKLRQETTALKAEYDGLQGKQEAGARTMDNLQKPLHLMRDLVKICVPGGMILDPFVGSGTTLEAAMLEGYGAVGIELNNEIADIAAKRLSIELS